MCVYVVCVSVVCACAAEKSPPKPENRHHNLNYNNTRGETDRASRGSEYRNLFETNVSLYRKVKTTVTSQQ